MFISYEGYYILYIVSTRTKPWKYLIFIILYPLKHILEISNFDQIFLYDDYIYTLKIDNIFQESYKQKLEIFGNLGPLPASVYEEFHKATGIEIDDRKDKMNMIAQHMETYIQIMIKFARHIPGFDDIIITDQIALLKGMRLID